MTIEQLERAIAGSNADAPTWALYAQRLGERGDYVHAAAAWRRVLDLRPDDRAAHIGRGVALARSNPDAFYAYMQELSLAEPKMAVDIFSRPECTSLLGQDRFRTLAKEAKAQAMD
jgi:tetratricopeptide (TPR) repeat protein